MIAGTWDDFLRFVNRASWAWNRLLGQDDENKLTGALATEQATTSGTSIDFTDIQTWVKKITVMLNGVSTNGTDSIILQIGDAGGVETAGYAGAASRFAGSAVTNDAYGGASFLLDAGWSATGTLYGAVVLTLQNPTTNTWVCSAILARGDVAANRISAGTKALSATLDRVRLTTSNGTDTFDAGAVNILYE